MDEDLILREIVKSLAFEIEAVNKDNILTWTTTNGTPLHVKVRVRNKDEPRLIQKGVIPVPRIGITAPEKLRLISSDQTILSFNVYLDGETEKKPKCNNGLKLFNIGRCLGTYSDDEGPYLPSSSDQNDVESGRCSKSSSGILKKTVSSVLSSINTVPHTQKSFFGKCRPGGCLDPPFDEDNYAYNRSKVQRQENLQIECNKVDDNKDSCKPGGCLDPPFSEDKYPYTVSKSQLPVKLEFISQLPKDEKQKLINKSSEERLKTLDKKTIKEEDDSNKLMDIYATIPRQNSLEAKYSNSIITYPTDVSSNETLCDRILNKKLSIKSNDDEAQRKSYDYPVSYFVPPKDVMRYKEEERRYSRRFSSETIDKISKSTAYDKVDETKYMEYDSISQYVTPSKDIQKKEITPHYTDDATFKSYSSKRSNIVGIEQENSSFVDIPSYVAMNSKTDGSYPNCLDEERASKYQRSTESNPNLIETEPLVLQQQIVAPIVNVTLYYEKTSSADGNMKTKHEKPIVERPEEGSKDRLKNTLFQSEAGYTISTQSGSGGVGSHDAAKDVPNIHLEKQSTLQTENSKFSSAHSLIKHDSKLNFGSNNNNDLSKTSRVAEVTIPVIATAKLVLSKQQSLQLNDRLNIGLDSSATEKCEASISTICSADFFKKSTVQKLVNLENEPKYLSPQSISSSENNEFDVSSEHSLEFKQELSDNVGTRNAGNTIDRKEKQELASTNNVIVGKNTLKDDYIKSDPESEKRRTSAILQKKAFPAKHGLDIEYIDINKPALLKRNTFTVIASDTSIQKCEEIEEMPEDVTDVYFKTTDIPKFSSTDLNKSNTVITDTNNKKLEGNISLTPRISEPVNVQDLDSKISEDTKAKKIDSRTKNLEGTFYTDVAGNLSLLHTHSEHLTNMNLAINRRNPNMTSNQEETNIDPLRNRLPTNVRDIDTHIVETAQSPLKIETLLTKYQESETTKANYEEMELFHNPENIHDFYLINENAKSLDIGTKNMERPRESVKDSLQKTISGNIQDLHAKVSVSDEAAVNKKPENDYCAKGESEKKLDSKILKNTTENVRSNIMTDSKLVADSTTEIPENARYLSSKIYLDDELASFTKHHKQPELIDRKDLYYENELTNDNMGASPKLLANNLHTENGEKKSVDVASDRTEAVNIDDNSKVTETPVVVPEFVQVLNDKNEQKLFEYKELENVKHDVSATDFVPKIILENFENVQAHTNDDEYNTNFGKIYDKNKLLITHSIVHLTEKVPELSNLRNDFYETQDVEYDNYGLVDKKKSSIPSSSHLGLLSEVLSNIAEDREEEENINLRNKSVTGTNGRHEDFFKLNTKDQSDYETFDNEFTSISKESESKSMMSEIPAGSNYSHKTKDSSYIVPINNFIKNSESTIEDNDYNKHKETSPGKFKSIKKKSNSIEKDYAKINITRDVAQLYTTEMIYLPSEYQSPQNPASIHEFNGLNKDNIGANPISPYGQSRHYQQPNTPKPKVLEESNIVATESSFSEKSTIPLYVDMAFYSYINDEKQRVVQTQSPRIDKPKPNDGTVTIVKTLIRHGNEIRIPVDNEYDISLNILDKGLRVEKRNSIIGLPICQSHREKQVVDRANKRKDCLNKNLALIYENELIPLHTVIKDLTQEVNTLAAKQEILQTRMRNTKRTKSLRLIPVVKRCGCRRI